MEPFPVILYGSKYWKGLLDWLKTSVLAESCTVVPHAATYVEKRARLAVDEPGIWTASYRTGPSAGGPRLKCCSEGSARRSGRTGECGVRTVGVEQAEIFPA